jgi:hypothetical protein
MYVPNNFRVPEATFMKCGMCFTATKPTSTVYVVYPYEASQFTEAKP